MEVHKVFSPAASAILKRGSTPPTQTGSVRKTLSATRRAIPCPRHTEQTLLRAAMKTLGQGDLPFRRCFGPKIQPDRSTPAVKHESFVHFYMLKVRSIWSALNESLQ